MTSPDFPQIHDQAQAILLEREIRMLQELLAELTPYSGELPNSLEQYQQLPQAHQRQLAAAHPQHIGDLFQVEELLAQATENDRQKEQQKQQLAGLEVDIAAAFDALDPSQRASVAMTFTRGQRFALYGDAPTRSDGGYL